MEFDQAFDEFIAAGLAPWIVGRIGEGLNAVRDEQNAPQVPENALDAPRLEGDLVADVIGGGHGVWFLPEFRLVEADPAFGFTVTQTGDIADDGEPFNRATLTLSLRAVMPPHLADFAEIEHPRQVPDLIPGARLTLPITAPDGSTRPHTVPGTTEPGADGRFVASFELTGSEVEAAYVHLTRRGMAGLDVEATYTGYQTAFGWMPDTGFPIHGPVFQGVQFEVFGNGGTGFPFEPIDRVPGIYVFFPSTVRLHRTIPVGLAFNTDTYRSRFTITAEGMTRPIIDGNDLNTFAGPRSEYRELTTLGDVPAKYPSLRRIYFGEVSGTVVAVPAAYGIVVTSQGLLAACDSVVDDSPVTVSGCRFHFTFTIGPMADPIDMAQLRADISTVPEAAGRILRVTVPGGLDFRTSSTLDGFPAAQAAFTDGDGSDVQVGIDIADDRPTPATTDVNLFLQQLASTGPAPLFGTLAVRLDDVFPQPVRTQMLLNLRRTAHRDDLGISIQPGGLVQPPIVQATNRGPLDLELHRCAAVRERPGTIVPLGDEVLAAGRTTILPGVGGGSSVEVSRSLSVPSPLPKAKMLTFVRFHTHTVQEVQHPLTVNAAGLNFGVAGVTLIDVQITLTAIPGNPVPPMTLSPSHPIDFVHVTVPVDSAVTGLDSTVALTLTTSSGRRTVSLSHDFVDQPILIVTSTTIQ